GPAALTHLYLHDNALAALPAGLLAGLDELTELRLDGNVLGALPAGLFTGVGALSALRLDGNRGAPFTLTMELEQDGDTSFRVRVATGAPFEMSAGFAVAGGTPAAGTVTVPTGATTGERRATVPSVAGMSPVITLGDPPPVPHGYAGLRTAIAGALTFITRPDRPENLEATGEHESIRLRWRDPGDTTITGYQVRYRSLSRWQPWRDAAGSDAPTTSHVLTGLTNDAEHDVQLRARNAAGAGPASEAGATPRAGLCGRSDAVISAILAVVDGIDDCRSVTAAHLAGIRDTLALAGKDVAALQPGDFDGLINLGTLDLSDNDLTGLPAGIFDSLGSLIGLSLHDNKLTELPAGAFRALTELTSLSLDGNRLTALPAAPFAGLAKLETLRMNGNDLAALAADTFAGLAALRSLHLHGNELAALPAGLFDGLSALADVRLDGNPGAPFPLTMALEQVEDDEFRVGVASGAPFSMSVAYTIADGTPQNGTVTVAAGATISAPVSVAADEAGTPPTITLGSPPTAPNAVVGFAIAVGGPLTLRDLADAPAAPAGLAAAVGDTRLVLTWTDPGDRTVTGYEVRVQADGEAWGSWTAIAGSNAATTSHRVVGLVNGTAYEVQIRARNADRVGAASASARGTPTAGICARTPVVQAAILAQTYGISDCAQIAPIHLHDLGPDLLLAHRGIERLQVGDFDGLANVERLTLDGNRLQSLPLGLFVDLGKLRTLGLSANDGLTLTDTVFDGLTSLTALDLGGNSLQSLPPYVFDGLRALETLDLSDNSLAAIPAGALAGIGPLSELFLDGNPGAPFTLTMELQQVGEHAFTVTVAPGAPFTMSTTFTIAGGEPASGTGTVDAGTVESASIAFTPELNATPVVTLGAPPLVPAAYRGVRTAVSAPLTMVGLPAQPTGLVATASDGAIRLAWTDPGDVHIIDYVLRYREQGGSWVDWSILPDSSATTISHRLTGLTNATAYDVELRARVRVGAGPAAQVSATPRAGICDRTTAVVDAILARVTVTDCALVTAAHLAGIVNPLYLTGQDLTALKPGDFDGLTNLTFLDLRNNRLTALPVGVFDELTAMTALGLARNELTALPDGVFDKLTALNWLALARNELTALPAGVFDQLKSLTQLNLHNNAVAELAADTFAELSSLTTLRLQGNRISSLPDGLFAGLHALSDLSLESNPGAPFTFTMALEPADLHGFRVRVVKGAPFPLSIGYTATGSLTGTLSVATGAVLSAPVALALPFAVFLGTAPAVPPGYSGVSVAAGGPPLLTFPVVPRLDVPAVEGVPVGEYGTGHVADLDGEATLAWGQPGAATIDYWEYRVRNDPFFVDPEQGAQHELVHEPDPWLPVPESGPGAPNAHGFTVQIVENQIYWFQVRAVYPSGAGSPSNRVLVIDEGSPDPTPVVQLAAGEGSREEISEAGGTTAIWAYLRDPLPMTVVAKVSTLTPPGIFFTLSEQRTLTIAAGETRSTGTVTITAVDNAVDEPDRTVSFHVDAGSDPP
ncbi:MAG: fibronectin type III domain-containing protein, partial [Spirochaetaceae bacterium]|nr:fibronectin type III domain-containing protein [Spirochaetaceae bacterium]